jgi:hypothetical protein
MSMADCGDEVMNETTQADRILAVIKIYVKKSRLDGIIGQIKDVSTTCDTYKHASNYRTETQMPMADCGDEVINETTQADRILAVMKIYVKKSRLDGITFG